MDDLFQDTVHSYARVFGVPNAYKIAMKINGHELTRLVGKASGIEIYSQLD